ncbi:hypothetical protein NL676_014317 [Syzygium grande]|nr:hypothetical protein NL676_014317 [Syzygium grande]
MAPPAAAGGGGGAAAAGGAGGGGGEQRREQGGFSLTGIIRIAVFWYFASKFFSPKKPSDPAMLMSNLFQKGESLDMWVYLSEQEKFNDFGSEGALVWHEANIPYADWGPHSTRFLSLTYHPSEALKNNGSLYAHVFFARSGFSPDPSDPEYQPLSAFGKTHPVVIHLPKSRADKRKRLLGVRKNLMELEAFLRILKKIRMRSLLNGFHIGSPMSQLISLRTSHGILATLYRQILLLT